ncbi:hypothetical protein THAOC_29670, partial [Thalassiosira oceanica]
LAVLAAWLADPKSNAITLPRTPSRSGPAHSCLSSLPIPMGSGKTPWAPNSTSTSITQYSIASRPVPEPGHLRRAGLSQSWPEPVPCRFLREYPPADLARQNGQLARPHSVLAILWIAVKFLVPKVQIRRNWFDECCLSKYEKPASSQSSTVTPLSADRSSSLKEVSPFISTPGPIPPPPQRGPRGYYYMEARLDALSTTSSSTLSGRGGRPLTNSEASMATTNAHHSLRAKDSRYRSAVGGNSGHSGLLWGIEEHVKKIEAIHGNSSGVDTDAVVVNIFPGRTTYVRLQLRVHGYMATTLCCFFARASLT